MKVWKIALGVALGIMMVMGACVALIAGSTNSVKARSAVVRIEAPADLCWSGSIGDATREGCGDARFDVETSFGSLVSANAQKKSDKPGTLTIIAEVDGKEVGRNSTSAAFGIAQVVSQP